MLKSRTSGSSPGAMGPPQEGRRGRGALWTGHVLLPWPPASVGRLSSGARPPRHVCRHPPGRVWKGEERERKGAGGPSPHLCKQAAFRLKGRVPSALRGLFPWRGPTERGSSPREPRRHPPSLFPGQAGKALADTPLPSPEVPERSGDGEAASSFGRGPRTLECWNSDSLLPSSEEDHEDRQGRGGPGRPARRARGCQGDGAQGRSVSPTHFPSTAPPISFQGTSSPHFRPRGLGDAWGPLSPRVHR